MSRDQTPHKGPENCWETEASWSGCPFGYPSQESAVMLEELLDREVCWCCLQTVGNVLFWDTHSSFPKSHIWQRHPCSRCFTTAVASLLVELSEHVPGFPPPLYNSSEAENSKFVPYIGFLWLPYSREGFPYHKSQALLSMLRVKQIQG